MAEDFKRLFRSRTEMRLAGVCGGIGVFFKIDPVIVRLVWVAITLMTGVVPGLLAYLVAWIIVPQEPSPVTYAQRDEQANEGPA